MDGFYFKLCEEAEFTRGICGLLDRELLFDELLCRLSELEFVEDDDEDG